MRNHLVACAVAIALPAAAWGADYPVKAPPVVPVAPLAYSWTGFYIGGNIGGAWAGNSGWTDSISGLAWNNGNNGTFIGGGQIGFNYQFGNFVLGVEADADWAANNSNNAVGVVVPAVGTIAISGNDRWISTLAARFGVAFDQVLLYGKVGGGWVGADNFAITNVTTGTSIAGLNGSTNSGWLVGAGLEWGFAPSWSVKFEYDYLGLNSRTLTVPLGSPFLAGDVFTTGNRNIQMAKVGVNYLFNWGAYRY